MFARILGRIHGYSHGLGGSMHFAYVDLNMISAHGVVGAGMPIGTGAANSTKIRGTDGVSGAFPGDGASNQVFLRAPPVPAHAFLLAPRPARTPRWACPTSRSKERMSTACRPSACANTTSTACRLTSTGPRPGAPSTSGPPPTACRGWAWTATTCPRCARPCRLRAAGRGPVTDRRNSISATACGTTGGRRANRAFRIFCVDRLPKRIPGSRRRGKRIAHRASPSFHRWPLPSLLFSHVRFVSLLFSLFFLFCCFPSSPPLPAPPGPRLPPVRTYRRRAFQWSSTRLWSLATRSGVSRTCCCGGRPLPPRAGPLC
jgi:hypothetical protein